MPRRLAPILLALLALAAPAVASATPRVTLHDQRVHRITLRALHRAEAVREGRGVKTGFELTPLLKEVAVGLRTLTGADHARARRLLERPTMGDAQAGEDQYTVPEHSPPYCSAHFCIHWVDTTADAPPAVSNDGDQIPDYVQTMSQVFEHVYQTENVQLGWRVPNGDGTTGGDLNKVDVYIKDVGGQGIFGYSTPDPGQVGTSQHAYLVMDNDFSHAQFPRYTSYLQPMEVTAAHEYNHVIQFGYDVLQDTWMLESTAVWMEDKVYDDVNDYLSYLGPWVKITRIPLTQFNEGDQTDPLNVKVYGDAVWNRWIDSHYGQEAIRGAWERSRQTHPASFAPAAYSASLSARGSSFFAAFTRFAADTAEWRSSASPFGDRDANLFPDVLRASPRSLAPGAKSITGKLDHTTFALLNVTPTAVARMKLVGSIRRGTAGAIALVGRRGLAETGPVEVQLRELPKGGTGTVTLAQPSAFSRITAVLVNADVSETGFSQTAGDWLFSKNGAAVSAAVSTDFTPPRIKSRTPRPNQRGVSRRTSIVLHFSKAIVGATSRSVELIDGRGHRVRAGVRVSGSTVTVTPRGGLRPNTHYTVLLTSAVVDRADNSVASDARRWSFSTRKH